MSESARRCLWETRETSGERPDIPHSVSLRAAEIPRYRPGVVATKKTRLTRSQKQDVRTARSNRRKNADVLPGLRSLIRTPLQTRCNHRFPVMHAPLWWCAHGATPADNEAACLQAAAPDAALCTPGRSRGEGNGMRSPSAEIICSTHHTQ